MKIHEYQGKAILAPEGLSTGRKHIPHAGIELRQAIGTVPQRLSNSNNAGVCDDGVVGSGDQLDPHAQCLLALLHMEGVRKRELTSFGSERNLQFPESSLVVANR